MDLQYLPGADVPPIQFDDDDEISPEEAQMVGLSAKNTLNVGYYWWWGPMPESYKKVTTSESWLQVLVGTSHLNVQCKKVTTSEYWLQVVEIHCLNV